MGGLFCIWTQKPGLARVGLQTIVDGCRLWVISGHSSLILTNGNFGALSGRYSEPILEA